MPIEQLTPNEEIEHYTQGRLEQLQGALLRNLQIIGERCVHVARKQGTYKDQTGNLRSSVGYVISVDGRIVAHSSFSSVGEGGDGAKRGLSFAKRVARSFPHGVCLVVVAGMQYASYVSAKGYDVLDSSELLASDLTAKMLRRLGIK